MPTLRGRGKAKKRALAYLKDCSKYYGDDPCVAQFFDAIKRLDDRYNLPAAALNDFLNSSEELCVAYYKIRRESDKGN